MTNSMTSHAFNLDLGSLLNGIDLGSILDSLLDNSSIFDGLDLGNIFDSLFGNGNIFDSIDLGDLFSNLGIDNLFGSTSLSSIFDSLGNLGLSGGLNIGSLVDDLSGLFGKINLGNLFGGLDDNYYYIFSKAPANDLISGLGSITGLTNKGSNKTVAKSVNPQKVDLLDGFGSLLNTLGEDNILKNVSIKHVLTGDAIANTVRGLRGDNLLVGLKGDDTLRGNSSEDLVNGGKGNDNLVGGSGDDLFVLDLKGKSVVQDFRIQDDKIGLLGSLSFGDLKIAQDGRDTIVSVNNKTLAVLQGVDKGQITASSFTQLG